MASEMKTIYSLSDPRTGEIRYIGMTSDVAARMRAHSNASAAEGTPLHAWLTELKKRKLSPVLTDLARVWHDGTCDVETMTISLLGLSCDLVNVNQTSYFPHFDAERERELARLRERNQEMVRLHLADGLLMSEIGELYGMTRERVRQILRREGVTPEQSAQARRVEWTCDHCGKIEFRIPSDTSRFCSRECAAEAGAVGHRKYSKQDLINHLRDLARRLGYTPGVNDLIKSDGPSHTCYYYWFDSLREAQELAGLIPNETGRPAYIFEDRKAARNYRSASSRP